MAQEPLICVKNINHYFGSGVLRKQILFDISTNFYPGEIVILTGPSGSGKTTLLTLAGALRSVQEGSLTVLGHELHNATTDRLASIRKSIGFIFQAHNLLEALTARQNIQMSLALHGNVPKVKADEKAIEMLTAVGLSQRIDYYPSQLSGGQKQRVAIARALIARPQIILADEPTAALDKKSGREVVEILQKLAKQQGAAILLVTHDNRILDVADRILTLEDGRITSFAKGLTANAGQMLDSLAKMNRRGMLARHIRNLPPEKFVSLLEESTKELDDLIKTIEVAERQVSQTMLDQVLEAATEKIVEMIEAERGTIFLKDNRNQQLRSKIATHDGKDPLEIVVSVNEGIAGQVARSGQALNIPDAPKHPLFNAAVDRATGFSTRNILCLPILNRRGEVFAVAQLLNKKGRPAFDANDQTRFVEFARPLGLILETCFRLESTTRLQREGAENPAGKAKAAGSPAGPENGTRAHS